MPDCLPRSASTADSRRRKPASACAAKISGMEQPARRTISSSASRNVRLSAAASAFPTELLPQPEIARRRQGQLAPVRLLREIAWAVAAEGEAARVFGVGLDQRGVVEQLQKRGFAVALLANNGAALAGAERQAEARDHGAQVAAAGDVKVVYRKHEHSSFPCAERKKRPAHTGSGRAKRAHAV